MNTVAPTILIRQAHLAYDNITLFSDLNLTLGAGKFTCLLGASGVGKSTLLRMIAQLISNTKSTKFFAEIGCDNLQPLAHQISYMAQDDMLLPWLNTLENALLSARLNGNKSPEMTSTAIKLLIEVGLKPALYKYPRELSGGMKQRVALVRTLLQKKPIVLMDEPFSGLDALTRYQIQTLTVEFLRKRTVLFITHDPLEALRLADDIYILSGQPAKLSSPFRLHTSTPRDPANPDVLAMQASLFHLLLQNEL